ncbi:MAG: ABC transporter ATP-binding protein [Gammaproteobacteria bacterium]|nr:ABC transporter ATP-binding protein [Gammaproteobacteria bacterium]
MPLNISNISKSYLSETVLADLSLQLQQGEIFSLVGINGAGKTTLIKCMLDFHKADQGHISLFGIASDMTSSRDELGYLPERFLPPYYLNGQQFLKYIFDLHKSSVASAAISQMLQDLDLSEDILNKSVREFSKGMAQKLGLAALLLLDKKLLILDEPMSGLDPKARVLIKQQLKRAKQKGKTIFFSSHLLADVEELSDRIGILHEGKIAYCGTADECKTHYQAETLEDAFLNCIS